MSYPDVFATARASAAVQAALGANPTRLWPFGLTPDKAPTPYAVHQRISSAPENYLAGGHEEDRQTIQIDVYGTSASECRAAADTLRLAYERAGHFFAGWNGDFLDAPTGLFRVSFDIDFWITEQL